MNIKQSLVAVKGIHEFLRSIKIFIGQRTSLLIIYSICIGFGWFLVETTFIYVLQIFLVAIGLISQGATILPTTLAITITTAVVALIGFGFLRCLVQYLRYYVSGIANQSFVKLQRISILEIAMQRKSKHSSHEIITLFNEMTNHAGVVLLKITEFAVSATSLVFFLGAAFFMAPYELVISVSLLTICIYPLRVFNLRIHEAGLGVQREYQQVSRTMVQTIKNRLFLDFSGMIETQVGQARDNLTRYEKHYVDFFRVYSLKTVAPNFLGIVIIAGVTVLSLKYFKTEPIKLIGFFYIFLRICQTASEAGSTISDFRLHIHSFKKLKAFMALKDGYADGTDLNPRTADFNTLAFDNVSFSYAHKPLIENFNLVLSKGDSLLIQGPSGVGKSTLVLLLCGLARPTKGRILVDNQDLLEMSIKHLISYTGPEPFLIDGSIRSNILFGIEARSFSENELIDACKKAEIWDLVSSFPEQLDYNLAENAELSTGQRQRIALVRCFLRDSKLFIFDEATSNIDYELEQKILKNIQDSFGDKLIIFISHRDTLSKYVNKHVDLSPKSMTQGKL